MAILLKREVWRTGAASRATRTTLCSGRSATSCRTSKVSLGSSCLQGSSSACAFRSGVCYASDKGLHDEYCPTGCGMQLEDWIAKAADEELKRAKALGLVPSSLGLLGHAPS